MREFLQTAQFTRGVEKDHPAERLIRFAAIIVTARPDRLDPKGLEAVKNP
jgi:hypothetical protein